MAGDKTDYYWDITDYPDDGSFVITDEVVFTTHDMSGDPDWQEGVHTSPGREPEKVWVLVQKRGRGRPRANLENAVGHLYTTLVTEVHRQVHKFPGAKLDTEIVPRVAKHFGEPERTVWRALKWFRSIFGNFNYYTHNPKVFAFHEEMDRRLGRKSLGRDTD